MKSYSKKKGKRSRRRSSRSRKQRGGQKGAPAAVPVAAAPTPLNDTTFTRNVGEPAGSQTVSSDAYIPFGIEQWLNKHEKGSRIDESLKNSQVFFKGALRYLNNAFPDRPETVGGLLEPTGVKMHAAIVRWLQDQMTIVPENHRSNLKAAYTYIKNAFPEEDTTESMLEAAKNQLKFGEAGASSDSVQAYLEHVTDAQNPNVPSTPKK